MTPEHPDAENDSHQTCNEERDRQQVDPPLPVSRRHVMRQKDGYRSRRKQERGSHYVVELTVVDIRLVGFGLHVRSCQRKGEHGHQAHVSEW